METFSLISQIIMAVAALIWVGFMLVRGNKKVILISMITTLVTFFINQILLTYIL